MLFRFARDWNGEDELVEGVLGVVAASRRFLSDKIDARAEVEPELVVGTRSSVDELDLVGLESFAKCGHYSLRQAPSSGDEELRRFLTNGCPEVRPPENCPLAGPFSNPARHSGNTGKPATIFIDW